MTRDSGGGRVLKYDVMGKFAIDPFFFFSLPELVPCSHTKCTSLTKFSAFNWSASSVDPELSLLLLNGVVLSL